jgi:hypothetical protein
MKLKVIEGFSPSLVESQRYFCEDLLAKSRSMRHRDSAFILEIVPTLTTYEEQVGSVTTLLVCAHSRSRHIFLAVHAAITVSIYSVSVTSDWDLNPAAEEELQYLKHFLGPRCPPIDDDFDYFFSLKDLGWTLEWEDPNPDCTIFQNSLAEVEFLREPLSVGRLLEYGLVPSDLGEDYEDRMRTAGLLNDESDALLAKHNGNWRALVRSESLSERLR